VYVALLRLFDSHILAVCNDGGIAASASSRKVTALDVEYIISGTSDFVL